MNNKRGGKVARAKLVKLYGGEEAYREHMRTIRRKRKDYTNSGFAAMKQRGEDDRIRDAASKSAEVRRQSDAT